jgi:hypothetical protein
MNENWVKIIQIGKQENPEDKAHLVHKDNLDILVWKDA